MAMLRPLRADAKRNRAAIIAAAREILESGDFFGLRFDDFAGLAGVGTGTLYRHFPTREDLVAAIFGEEVVTLVGRARALQAALPADQALAAFLREMVAHIRDHEGLARSMASVLGTRSESGAGSSEPLEQVVAELVAAGAADGSIREDARPGALMLVLHSIGAARDRPDWRAETDDLVAVVIDGLRPR